MKLNIGDTKERVLEVMGKPITREAYPDKEFLIYYTGNGMGQEGSTPIKLVNGKVVGWGQNYIEESTNKKTQTIDLNVKQR
jgi:outer membrane protein assembly factor BamE (lipoprotein component of BamABCDE complex)